MLQAVQAAVVYGMLCSQCADSVSSDDSAWLVATIEVCYHSPQTTSLYVGIADNAVVDIRRETIRHVPMGFRCRPLGFLAQ